MPTTEDYHSVAVSMLDKYGIGRSLVLIADTPQKVDWLHNRYGADILIHNCAPAWDTQRGIDFEYDLCVAESAVPRQYDSVFCHCVLEHCINPFMAVQKLLALLVPGGVLYLTMPGFPSQSEPQEIDHFHTIPKFNGWDFFRVTTAWTTAVLVACDAEILEISFTNALINAVARKGASCV
jgi:SAM-dependent methyltransferase